MHTVTITLNTFTFRRADHVMEIDPELFNADIIAQLVYHGATQKIGDAAAGKSDDDALKAMNAVYNSLVAGDWGRARTSNGDPEWFADAMNVIRANLSPANKALYKDMKGEAKEREAFIRGLWDGLNDETRAKVEARARDALATRKAEKARNKEIGEAF